MRGESVSYNSGRMLVTKNEVFKIWKEYSEEPIGDDGERNVSIGTVRTEIRREK